MAAVTVASQEVNVVGRQRQIDAVLTAPADADTWTITALNEIHVVQVTFKGDGAAADSVSASASGNVITFNVIGTARDIYVTVRGR